MNIDKFLKFFVPKDHSFHPLFEEAAINMVAAAETLNKMVQTPDTVEHEKLHREIKDLEHKGDIITDKAYLQLNKSFITPFDREDIHELTSNIDDVLDSINGVARRICLYKPKNLLPVYKEMTIMILEAAGEIKKSIHHLYDAAAYRKEITSACNKVKEIEHRVDDYYFVAVAELFEKEKDAAELLKNNKILEILERIVDEQEDVSDTIKSILIKMA
jgi:predicted phosphate transport protein (TIGR00153 family)